MSDDAPIEVDDTEDSVYWGRGYRAAHVSMLSTVLGNIGYQNTEESRARWIIEREQAIAKLRTLCEELGDNDWDETLHLGDVIDKHVLKYVMAPPDPVTIDDVLEAYKELTQVERKEVRRRIMLLDAEGER